MDCIIIKGVGYIPEEDSEYKKSHKLTKSEMNESVLQSVRSLPVYIEHDTSVQIGEVLRGYYDGEDRRLMVDLWIYSNIMIISQLSDCISKDDNTSSRAFFTGISAGTAVTLKQIGIGPVDEFGKYSDYYTAPESAVFTEFSIVQVPDCKGCLIQDWYFTESFI